MMKVSVCVPTFERPETTRLLIESFLAQDHADRELSIADDSKSDAVERLVAGYADKRIVYHHQKEAVGFRGNLMSCLKQSSGEVAMILGDDDVLARTDSLSIYAASFASNPAIGYACANVVQIDGSGEVTFAYVAADEATVYEKGPQAIQPLFLSSVHIAGIASRRIPDLREHYPSEEMLFPQVKLASQALSNYAGMAIRAFLSGAGASKRQIGFVGMKRNRVGRRSMLETELKREVEVGPRRGNVEAMQIADRLRKVTSLPAAVAVRFERNYVKSYATNTLAGKIMLGNSVLLVCLRLLWHDSGETQRALLLGLP